MRAGCAQEDFSGCALDAQRKTKTDSRWTRAGCAKEGSGGCSLDARMVDSIDARWMFSGCAVNVLLSFRWALAFRQLKHWSLAANCRRRNAIVSANLTSYSPHLVKTNQVCMLFLSRLTPFTPLAFNNPSQPARRSTCVRGWLRTSPCAHTCAFRLSSKIVLSVRVCS